MTAKQLMYDEDARRRILDGARKLARAVKVTLGPGGHNVLLQRTFGCPIVSNDGVTVSKEIELGDPFENMGAKLVHEVCSKTNDMAGDGTTTACVLAEAILEEGNKVTAAGINPIELKRGIEKAVAAALAHIRANSRPVKSSTDIQQVGTVSANYDERVGRMFADAMAAVGPEGVISVEEGRGLETVLELTGGYQFDKGYVSPYLVTDAAQQKAEMENVLILITDRRLSSVRELIPVLEQVSKSRQPLLIIADELENEVLATLIHNHLNRALVVCAVKSPAFGDRRKAVLQDLAVLTGGTYAAEELGVGLDTLTVENLGRAAKVRVTASSTTLVNAAGKPEAIKARAETIRQQLTQTTSEYDRDFVSKRLAKLTGGVAVIKVGAKTEAEMKELKLRVDDALHATRAAAEEGIVPGGGTALLRAIDAVRTLALSGDEEHGRRILMQALRRPAMQIAINAGYEGGVVVSEVLKRSGNVGFDALTGEYVDMMERGVVDPAKVVCAALQNAASVATLLLCSNTAICDLPTGQDVVPVAVR